MHNISKLLLKTSTAHIKHATTSIFANLSKGTKVVLQVDHLAENINQWCDVIRLALLQINK